MNFTVSRELMASGKAMKVMSIIPELAWEIRKVVNDKSLGLVQSAKSVSDYLESKGFRTETRYPRVFASHPDLESMILKFPVNHIGLDQNRREIKSHIEFKSMGLEHHFASMYAYDYEGMCVCSKGLIKIKDAPILDRFEEDFKNWALDENKRAVLVDFGSFPNLEISGGQK